MKHFLMGVAVTVAVSKINRSKIVDKKVNQLSAYVTRKLAESIEKSIYTGVDKAFTRYYTSTDARVTVFPIKEAS